MHHKKTLATHKIANFAFDDGAYHSPVPIIHLWLLFRNILIVSSRL
jgi:hypothetical protein